MTQTRTRDMTQGNPTRLILAFALPLLLGGVFQQLYNLVDTAVVGRFVSVDALGALGATSSTVFCVLALVMGLTNGVSVVVAQYFGAKDEARLKRAVANAVVINLAASVIMSAVGVALARPIMNLLGTPPEILDMAVTYLTIVFAGSVAQITYNTASAILRAVGDSRTPLYFLILASLLNVALDLVFVIAFKWGVAGVAVATILAQAVSAACCLVFMAKRYPILRFSRRDLSPDRQIVARVLRIGLPMGLQSALLGVGMMVIQSVINSFGSAVVSGYAAAAKADQISGMVLSNLGMATATYMGQNAGARDEGRIKAGFRRAMLISLAASLILSAVILLFKGPIISLFVAPEETLVRGYALDYLSVNASFYVFLGLVFLYNNALRAMGDVWVPLSSAFIELFLKVGGSMLLGSLFGPSGIWFAAPIGWILCLIPSIIRYHGGSWQRLLDRI